MSKEPKANGLLTYTDPRDLSPEALALWFKK